MLHNQKKLISTKIFNFLVKDVLKPIKITCDPNSSFVLLSQICSRDLYMYLVAVSTFTKHIKPSKIIVVADGLDYREIEILTNKISDIDIIDASSVDTHGFPSGGTWERLLTIIDKTKDHYVIQLDSDTLTLNEMIEVKECITHNRSFTLGTYMGQHVITFKEASENMQSHASSHHVQVRAELAMQELEDSNRFKYVRGCSGFAGFSQGGGDRNMLKQISQGIEQKIGVQKWQEWGSEQVSSNIVVANSVNPYILPISRYNYFKPGIAIEKHSFLHFIGEYRFASGAYWKLANSLLK